MEKRLLILVVGLFAVSTAIPVEDSKAKFVDYEVYKIENRLFPDGILSVRINPSNETDTPRLHLWSDDAGQKWRLDSSKLYSAFQLRPTAYESFVLAEYENDSFLKWVASLGNLGRNKLWYLNDAGNGFTQIKNKRFDSCLSARGMDAMVEASPCTNSEDQQWKFTKL